MLMCSSKLFNLRHFLPLYSADLDGFFPEAAAADSGVGQKLKQKGGASFIAELSSMSYKSTAHATFLLFSFFSVSHTIRSTP